MNRPRFGLLLASVAAALSLAATGCAGSGEESAAGTPLRIGQLVSYNTSALSKDVALGEQLSDGTPVEWTPGFEAFVPALEAANAGQIDAATGGLTNLYTGLNAGGDFVAVGVEDSSEALGIVASGESGITSIQELRGRSIAVNTGGTGEYLALRALDKAGLTTEDVELVPLTPTDAIAAFQSGNVDSIAIWDQYFATAQLQPGATVIADGRDLDSKNYLFVWVTRDWAEANPEQLQTYIEDLQATSATANDDPQRVLDYYRELGASEEVLGVIGQWEPYAFEPIGDEQVALITEHGQDLQRYGLIDQVPDVSGAVVRPDAG